MNKEFCLLDEPWIKVLNNENKSIEVSLTDVFVNAHKYKCLAGETATQDAAILRLLLAIAITVFYRYDADGNSDDVLAHIDPEDEILDRWSEYWERGSFEESTFRQYLETYRERFYLFHPKTPFWQVADLKNGTDYDIINLLGNIKESNNKASKHHFHMTDGEYIKNISFAEISRWLIFNNAYSKSIKYKGESTYKNAEVGYLSQLGFIVIDADNIFKLILLNLCALQNGKDAWGVPTPIWENESDFALGHELTFPDNLPELYTMQSRSICLHLDQKQIKYFTATRGDYYSKFPINTEQMTIMMYDKQKQIIPKKHNKSIETWKEFTSLFFFFLKLKPGIILWLQQLSNENLINENFLSFKMIGLIFEDETGYKFTYGNEINQTLSLSKNFLYNTGEKWIRYIYDEIEKCQNVQSSFYYHFSNKLASTIYKTDKDVKSGTINIQNALSNKYYYKIDSSFREWLISIDPNSSNREDKLCEWQKISSSIADSVVRDYIAQLSPQYMMLSAKAYNFFKIDLNKLYPKIK